jgi:hypothetical protein
MGTGSCPEVKGPGLGVDHPPPSSATVPSWPVVGRTLLYFTLLLLYFTFTEAAVRRRMDDGVGDRCSSVFGFVVCAFGTVGCLPAQSLCRY